MNDGTTLFEHHGIRATPARRSVLKYFLRIHSPVSIEQIKKDPAVKRLELDTVTLYRIVNLFTDKEILRQIDLHEGKFRYELASQQHHHHVVCINCGKIQDVDACIEEQWEKQVEKATKFQIQSHSLEFFGYCASCQ